MSHGPVSQRGQHFALIVSPECIFLAEIVYFIIFSFSQLMTREPLEKLGFQDQVDPPPGDAEGDAKP